MKFNLSKCKDCLVALLLMASVTGFATGIEETTISEQVFFANEKTRIELFNKYGNIQVNTWNNDSVFIRVTMRFTATSNAELRKMKSQVQVDITDMNNFIIAKTNFLNSTKGLLSILPLEIITENKTTIDYEVWMPESASLKLENKFGDVYVATLKNNVNIDVSHGQFKAQRFEGPVKLIASYCNTTISYIEQGDVSVRFGEITIDSLDRVSIESRSARVIVNSANNLQINGRNDDLLVRSAGDLNLSGYFSKASFSNVTGNVFTKTSYGNITLNIVPGYNGNINILSNYTDVSINYEGAKRLIPVEIKHQKSRIMYTQSNTQLKEEKISGKDVIYKTTGNIGTGRISTGKINVEMFSGELKLIVK